MSLTKLSMVGDVALAQMTFGEPWAARLFGLTLAVSETGLFTMTDFQAALIETVGEFEKASCIVDETGYYTRWLEALAALLGGRGLLDDDALSATEKRVVERLLDLQHHRRDQHSIHPGRPSVVAPLIVA